MPFNKPFLGSTQGLTRRSILQGGGVLAGAGLLAGGLPSAGIKAAHRPIQKTIFGSAAQIEPFRADPLYRQSLQRYCSQITPMNALKWLLVHPEKDHYEFGAADELVNFAQKNGMAVHGHNLLWYNYNPGWMEAISDKREAEKVLVEHIETVVDRYRGKIASWDVVNEVISHDPRETGVWRKSMWRDLLGTAHVNIAFAAAARADPKAKLIINDYDLGDWGGRIDQRRAAVLQIVRHLQDKNIPIHGVGLQAHLYAERRTDAKALVRFVGDLAALGLTVRVSELDVIDWRLSANPRIRDFATSRVVDEFLDALFEGGRPDAVSTWGLTDRYSWISDVFKRKDGLPNRPLPLDRDYKEKPMMDVLRKYTSMG